MTRKRKDHKGRNLRTGESQRPDLTYQYRYTDSCGKRKVVYAPTLQKLREKEAVINQQAESMNYDADITVICLLERYISLKQGVRYNTRVGYDSILNRVRKDAFGNRKIGNIKVSDAKLWFIRLFQEGKGYSTVNSIRGVMRPAFQMAYEEELLRRNPFDFKLTSVIPNNSVKRAALTPWQQETWMNFIRNDKTYRKYYDEFVVLLETGMRVSEFCGLTKSDLDFTNRKICVDHQLVRERSGKYYIEKTKTESGRRYIPMTDKTFQSLKNILLNRPKVKKEVMVDGHIGFLLLDKNSNPKVALHIENEIRWATRKYRKLHPDKPLPHITPHVLRHTFCTNMANAGMDLKSLQYLMGHSDATVTLNVYTHNSYEKAEESLRKICYFDVTNITKKENVR